MNKARQALQKVEFKHTSREFTISMFPKKWFKYSCIATFALSDIECCLPKAGRIIGRAALDGTSLNKKPTCKNYKNYKGAGHSPCLASILTCSRSHLFLALSSWCSGIVSSSGSSSSCTTGEWSPIPRFWSHSLTFNVMFQREVHQNHTPSQAEVIDNKFKGFNYAKGKHIKSRLMSFDTHLLLLLLNFLKKCTFLQCKM